MKQSSLWGAAAVMSLLVVSCAGLHSTRGDTHIVELKHIRGNRNTCLANCVDMVLDYYGVGTMFARVPGLMGPYNLLAMDSLLQSMSSGGPADPHAIQSFVLQADETFLLDQLSRERPVIVIYRSGKDQYHSVVICGATADHREYFVDDPARKSGQWVSRSKLLQRWKSTGNTALLIGLIPAGT